MFSDVTDVFIHEEIAGGLLAPPIGDEGHDHLGRKLQKQDGFKVDLRLDSLLAKSGKVIQGHKGHKVTDDSDDDGDLDDLEVMKAKVRVNKYCNGIGEEVKGEEGKRC